MKSRIFNNEKNQYEEVETRLRVVVNGRNRYFATPELANQFASDYFKTKGVVLGIELVPAKKAKKVKAK